MYIIEENSHALIIDPCRDISLFNSDVTYDAILLTHEHFDHISGVNTWKELTHTKVICSKTCSESICDPRKNFSRYFKEFCAFQTFVDVNCQVQSEDYSCEADIVFENDMIFEWQNHSVEISISTSHSPGGILVFLDRKYLFSGDTILDVFPPENRMKGIKKEVRKIENVILSKWPTEEVIIYPGHLSSFIVKK